MANRTGQGSPIIQLDRNTGVSGTTLHVDYSRTSGAPRNAGQAQFAIADVLKNISSRVEDRLDILAESEASREGALAGAADQLPVRGDDMTIRGRAFNRAADDAVAVRLDLKSREVLNQLEQENLTNPAGFEQKAKGYIEGAAPEIDKYNPALGQRFKAEYAVRAMAAGQRIKDRHEAIVRDRMMEQSFRYQLAVQDDLAADAASLFSGDAASAKETLARMLGNTGRMVDVANQIGPDGRPLYSARERVMMERNAQQTVAQQIGLAWMRKQPDMLQAWEDWQKGTASIEITSEDGTTAHLGLREMLGEGGYRMAGEAFMDTLRSELALQNQLEGARDRAFKQGSDALYSDLMVGAQDGTLTLQKVEQSRSFLEPDRYIAAREIAKGGFATVTDGAALSRLIEKDANGEDIRDELQGSKALIAQEDFVRLYERNVGRLDQGMRNPVDTGRDYLSKGLGALSTEIGLAQSVNIGAATTEYEVEIDKFVGQNNRQPTLTEARDIAEGVRARYSVLNVEDSLISLPLPRSMTAAEKLSKNLNTASIQGKLEKTNAAFLQKHGGNADLRDADPEYIREIMLLKNYYDLLKTKEENNGQRPASR